MSNDSRHPEPIPPIHASRFNGLKVGIALTGTLLLFIFAIMLMVSSLSNIGPALDDIILLATTNPFSGLFIGLLITAVLQSSSTTTALLVAFVASGSLTVTGAVPMIMGANIGTTITSTLVSLGFINKKKEFKRAVSAGTYHDFFNILTVLVLFPLEYYYQFLSNLSTKVALAFFAPSSAMTGPVPGNDLFGFGRVVNEFAQLVSPVILVAFAMGLLFLSIVLFRRIVSNLLKVKQPEAFSRFFFDNTFKSFTWGVVLTGAIRSSTITTSVVVPIVAKNIVSLRKAIPFILGANIGTTITAFIAVILYAHSHEALVIALAHFFFNIIGVLLFFPIPFLRNIPVALATGVGRLTMRHRLAGFIYILATFFLIPFILIALNRAPASTANPRSAPEVPQISEPAGKAG